MHATGQPGALERIPAGQRAWSGPTTVEPQGPAEGAHPVRARRRESIPDDAGLTTRHLINASSKDAVERISTTRSAASEPVAYRESLPAGRARAARSAPPRAISPILQLAFFVLQ